MFKNGNEKHLLKKFVSKESYLSTIDSDKDFENLCQGMEEI